jgi:hypothetical protein
VLELRDPELELLHLVPRDETELAGEARDALPRPLAEPGRIAAPACDRVLEHLTGLVATHSSAVAEVAGQLLDALGGQRDQAEGREPEPFDDVPV